MGKATVHQNMVVLSRLRAIAAQAQMIEDKRGEVAIADGVAPKVEAPKVTAPVAMPEAASASTAAEPKSDKTPNAEAADPVHKA